MIFLKLFWVFLKIGLLGFGGGYAMLSMIQDEVVTQNKWMTNTEFTDLVAVSQTTPGPIGINTATYVGFSAVNNAGYSNVSSILASILATVTVCLPAFILIILLSYSFKKFKDNNTFNAILSGIRPLSIALIGFAAYSLVTKESFSDYYSAVFFAGTLLASAKFKVHPIYIILVVAFLGIIIY